MTKNADPDKYEYFGYGTGLDALGGILLSNGSGVVKNVIIYGDDMRFSLHIDNKKISSFLVNIQ